MIIQSCWGGIMKIYDKSAMFGFFELRCDATPLAESEKIDIKDILRIKGELYRVCMMTARRGYAVVERLNVIELQDKPEELIGTDEIVCPYCLSHIESFEMDDSDDNYECTYCGSNFAYQREVIIAYNSQPVSKNENILEVE